MSTGARSLVAALALALASTCCWAAPEFDLVLANGRVVDPATSFDAVRDVAITGGKIAAISESRLAGSEVIDATGLVVTPGFIDFHAHGQDNEANRLQAHDGVTTALDLEGGRYPVADYYASRQNNAVLNYGVSVSHHDIRKALWPEGGDGAKWAYAEATPSDLEKILARFADGLADGGIGAGLALEYTPGVGFDEVYQIMRFMAGHHAPVTVHVRRARGDQVPPHRNIASIQEVLANAATTGVALHIVHITPSALRDIEIVMQMIADARTRGVDVSTEAYPYTAGSTSLRSAAFDEGWQETLGMGYGDLVWTATGERLTKETFEKYRSGQDPAVPATVIAHFIPEDVMRYAVAHPLTQIASDGLPWKTGGEHPRGAGTYARVLGVHVRASKELDLVTALSKMSFMPAQRLAPFVPAMHNKGRMAVGADADLTLFDAGRVIDRATYEKPMEPSAGIAHVLVNGTFVVRDGAFIAGALPGRPIRFGE